MREPLKESAGMHYHGHRARLRQRLQKNPEELPDYEILELLLGKVLARRDTKALAKDLLARFQSFRGVLDAKPAELEGVAGFGPALSSFWLLLREVLARYAESPLRRRETLASPAAVAEMARTRLAGHDHETVWAAFVDARNHLLAWERIAAGSVDQAGVRPRDILERALLLKASGFILVHNHPGGVPTASAADLEMTARLRQAAGSVGLRFLDHIIVADAESRSLLA
ncbi:MAG: DNA repair protein RadC [Deltaproteobacteria bacterium]|jgi:DNA repair protein RadC|nr:DNA repair protein RadC [Deltaproteobacteria bacterium]